jgi:hypothetical protein
VDTANYGTFLGMPHGRPQQLPAARSAYRRKWVDRGQGSFFVSLVSLVSLSLRADQSTYVADPGGSLLLMAAISL